LADGAPRISPAEAARELLRRRRARESLVAFSQAITIPGAPASDDPDSWLFKPIESAVALHHRVIMDEIQRCIETDSGRLLIFAPPGSAKSTYASVVTPPWAMARTPGYKVILSSYAATPAERQSKRARSIVGSAEFSSIWPERVMLKSGSSAVNEWELTNDSGLLAVGILGAVTSARADLLIIDDPVAGREEADSETIRKKTRQAYDDDLLTRLKPRASIIVIQTRWHMDDLAGSILPDDYDGRSGEVIGRDGQVWRVLNIQAKAERTDDPLRRSLGEYLWPEWFDARHWANYEGNPRTWASLYQQRPTPDTGGQFEREWFNWYDEPPKNLRIYGASDYAVTKKTLDTNPDFTEHGVFGVSETGDIYVLDWSSSQEPTDKTIAKWIAMGKQWEPQQWFDEGGVIRNATEPLKARMQAEAGKYIAVDYLPSIGDKIARVASFRGRASAGKVFLPKRASWVTRLLDQLCSFPFARYDDAVDVCGNLGRGLELVFNARATGSDKRPTLIPFTEAWFNARDREDAESVAEREDYYQ